MTHKEPLKKKNAQRKKSPKQQDITAELDMDAPLLRKTNDPVLLKMLLDLEKEIFIKAAKLKII